MKKLTFLLLFSIICLYNVLGQDSYLYNEIKRADTLNEQKFSIKQIYPNPFCGVDLCRFSIGDTSVLDISLYDKDSLRVVKYFKGTLDPGNYEFNVFDNLPKSVPEGLYYIKLESESIKNKTLSTKFSAFMKVFKLR